MEEKDSTEETVGGIQEHIKNIVIQVAKFAMLSEGGDFLVDEVSECVLRFNPILRVRRYIYTAYLLFSLKRGALFAVQFVLMLWLRFW